ncbi:MAG TPA: hypothetical protein VLT36_00060 [Candidatus Dormibacteraeota bacterium]|nr:hypothetical protein [Candidatus Dormibacteraeota bacterium]
MISSYTHRSPQGLGLRQSPGAFAFSPHLILVISLLIHLTAPQPTHAQTPTAYSLTMVFSNTIVWTVNGGPATISGWPFIGNAMALHTDSKGRITGHGWFWIDYSNAPYSAFVLEVDGKISSTTANPKPTVSLNLRGNGYSLNGSGGATPNKLNFKFTGVPAPNPVDPSQMAIVGNMSGSIMGDSPLGARQAFVNLPSLILETDGSPLIITNKVLQSGNKMSLFDSDSLGSGTINGNTYRFNLGGISTDKGWTLTTTGTMGTYTSSTITNSNFTAPVSAEVKGTVKGQIVTGSPTSITADLITGQ